MWCSLMGGMAVVKKKSGSRYQGAICGAKVTASGDLGETKVEMVANALLDMGKKVGGQGIRTHFEKPRRR